ncbi:hypothetical protein SteCoe_7589 [Stentor coeruleus]|uniref:Uncharacterized protein n=1 Tax=Stentor coeruleus TaxID=5963 RepID=A0A1R2CM59_9CILI|nr:hypothetical protein SteCoe_7589 [Stentor coeruleus]
MNLKPRKEKFNHKLSSKKKEYLASESNLLKSRNSPMLLAMSIIRPLDTPKGSNFEVSEEVKRDLPKESNKEKFKALEEIGIFSEFYTSNQVYDTRLNIRKQSTIHVADFMKKNDRMQLLLSTGDLGTYLQKKHEAIKSSFTREKAVERFFFPSEKSPDFYSKTPKLSPTYVKLPKINSPLLKKPPPKIEMLNNLIEKCEYALSLKPNFNEVNLKLRYK